VFALRRARAGEDALCLHELDHPQPIKDGTVDVFDRNYFPDPELAAVRGGERVTYRPVRDDGVELAELVTLA